MKSSLGYLLFSLFIFLAASSAYAETRYISDYLIVTVRSGKGNEFKVLETLPTATPVTVLNDGKAYVEVRTPKGTEGYIRKRYVSKSTPKTVQIKQLKHEVSMLQQQLETQQKNLRETPETNAADNNQINELTAQLNLTRRELDKISGEYNSLLNKSENIVNLTAENGKLIEDNNLLNSELLILREENQNFHRSNMIQWFLAGGGVFLGGWLIGKISRKKQRQF